MFANVKCVMIIRLLKVNYWQQGCQGSFYSSPTGIHFTLYYCNNTKCSFTVICCIDWTLEYLQHRSQNITVFLQFIYCKWNVPVIQPSTNTQFSGSRVVSSMLLLFFNTLMVGFHHNFKNNKM